MKFILFLFVISIGCAESSSHLDGPTRALIAPSGDIFVSDGYFNSRIAIFSATGEFLREWGGKGFAAGQFNTPHDLAFLSDGNLLVVDRDNGRIQKFTTSGKLLSVWDDPEMGRPWSITIGTSGKIFVTDGGDQIKDSPRAGIVELSSEGAVICRFSQHGSGVDSLDQPHMISIGDDGTLFVVDLKNKRIRAFAEQSSTPCDYKVMDDWPSKSVSDAIEPLGIVAYDGMVYVSDARPNEPIRVVDPKTGALVSEWGDGIFQRVHGISADSKGRFLVVDVKANRVFQFDSNGKLLQDLPK